MKKLILAAIIVAVVAMNAPSAKAGFQASFVDPLTHLSVSIGDRGYRAPGPVAYAPAPPVCYTPAPVFYGGGPRFVDRDYGHRDFDGFRDHRFDRDDHRGFRGGDRDDHRGGDRDNRGGDRDGHSGYRR